MILFYKGVLRFTFIFHTFYSQTLFFSYLLFNRMYDYLLFDHLAFQVLLFERVLLRFHMMCFLFGSPNLLFGSSLFKSFISPGFLVFLFLFLSFYKVKPLQVVTVCLYATNFHNSILKYYTSSIVVHKKIFRYLGYRYEKLHYSINSVKRYEF